MLEALSARIDQAPGFDPEQQPIIDSSAMPFSFEFFREDFGFSSEGFILMTCCGLTGYLATCDNLKL